MLDRITTLMTSQTMLGELNQQLNTLQNTQLELSSGKKINEPSDDPYGMGLSLQLNSNMSELTQYSSNVTDGTAWSQASTTALSDMSSVVQRVRELVVEGANGTNNASDLTATAAEVDQLIDQVKQDANTQYNGQYIFSGSSGTTQQPYQTGQGSSDTYQGGSGAVYRKIGPVTQVQVDVDSSASSASGAGGISSLLGNGQTTAGQPAGDGLLLNTLRNISDDMKSGNASNLGGVDLTDLDNNLQSLGQMQATVGTTQDGLQLASTRLADLQLNDTQVLSNTQDADMASTEINFSTEQAAYEAALKASASIVQESLVNFLGNG